MCWRAQWSFLTEDVLLNGGCHSGFGDVILNVSEESHAKEMLRYTQHDIVGREKRCLEVMGEGFFVWS